MKFSFLKKENAVGSKSLFDAMHSNFWPHPFRVVAGWMLSGLLAMGILDAKAQVRTNSPLTSEQRLERPHLQAVNDARHRFMRERHAVPGNGVYEEFRAILHVHAQDAEHTKGTRQELLEAARKRGIQVVMTTDNRGPKPDAWSGMHDGILFIPVSETGDGALWFPDYGQDGKPLPERDLRFMSHVEERVTHILARDLTESQVRESLKKGRAYVAHDWLCDPAGFAFGAVNNLGVFTMGDTALLLGKTRLVALTPLEAKLRLIHKGVVVQETLGTNLTFEAKAPGPYRIEAWLMVDGEDRPWIYSNPVYLKSPGLSDLRLPSMDISPGVETHKDISYCEGPEEESAKHKLDLYIPKGKAGLPVLFFIHGGAWKMGDRTQYPPLGNRYAREGCVTVIPSYRLAPKYPHPAQIDDVAAAFAWTVQHIAEYGGDTNRIYVAGHSAGGHLAALLSLDERHLAAHRLSPKLIRAVLALSGVYDLVSAESQDAVFGKDPEVRRAASPLFHVHAGAPPFLVTYCEWDYFSLPAQAREFYSALRQADVPAELVYVPGENHISEMLNVSSDSDPTVKAVMRFMK